jgi:DNA-binding protein Fis
LRERKDDIPLLVDHFVERFNRNNPKHIQGVHPRALGALLRYHWPGNVRQLENCLERAAVMADGPMLTMDELSHVLQSAVSTEHAHAGSDETGSALNLKEAESALIRRALRHVGGDRGRAAALLGISLRTLYYKLKTLDDGESPTVGRAVSERGSLSRPVTAASAGADQLHKPETRRQSRKQACSTCGEQNSGLAASVARSGMSAEYSGVAPEGMSQGHLASGTVG